VQDNHSQNGEGFVCYGLLKAWQINPSTIMRFKVLAGGYSDAAREALKVIQV
jgi:hypothetical protein